MNSIDPHTPIEKLKGVTERIVKPLHTLGISTIYDLLLHIPFRYEDFSTITDIARINAGATVTIQGTIERIENTQTWKKKMHLTKALVADRSGSIEAIWFNQPYLARTLAQGKAVNLSGKAVFGDGRLYLQNPVYETVAARKNAATHTGRLVPVYRETYGITSRWLRYLVKNALEALPKIDDAIPKDILGRQHLLPFPTALEQIHFPASTTSAANAKRRLAFEELFLIQLMVLNARRAMREIRANAITADIALIKSFTERLPFALTNAQRKAAWEILKDMEKSAPMNRLLEGDVGSGKTVVAAIAALNAGARHFQTAFMAPTEILAQQHFASFTKLFKSYDISIGLLTASGAFAYDYELATPYKIKKQDFFKLVREGKLIVVIGTHALIASEVPFHNLGLVVLDEQHRFGVAQRAALVKQSGLAPHFLSMTATPIPRTLALTAYGDLDISLLDEMPKNRKKVITKLVARKDREPAYAFIRKEIKSGRQVFVICPRIEAATAQDATQEQKPLSFAKLKALEVKSAIAEHEKLSKKVFPDMPIALLHGKMKAKEKERVMREFKENKHALLVSTSVVEVGVDVPNATIMMVESADRFGLAQLHQFRGRVGRGEYQSYCLLFTEHDTPESNRRLRALKECDNGFELAEKDLALRGPGDFLGGRQSGLPDLTMASLADTALIKTARDEALSLFQNDARLTGHPLLKKHLERFERKVHLE